MLKRYTFWLLLLAPLLLSWFMTWRSNATDTLDALSDLFEKRRLEPDEMKKKALYKQIDSLSYEASKYAIPNEYDKMVASLGAKGTTDGGSFAQPH